MSTLLHLYVKYHSHKTRLENDTPLFLLQKEKKRQKKIRAHKKKEPKKTSSSFQNLRSSLSLLSIDERGACDVLASSGCLPRREVSSAAVRGKRRGRGGGRGGGDAGRVGVFHLSELQARDDENDVETTTTTTKKARRRRALVL